MINFRKEAEALAPGLTATYMELHRNPELSYQEKQTTAYVADRLKQLGIAVTTWDDLTGLVGLLEGGKPGPCVALRADIDALPVTETSGLPHSSNKSGVMHACGHDGHTAALLGAAEMLSRHRDELRGTVKFLFQPAEETLTGAKAMLGKGVLDNPRPEFVFGMHNYPSFPTGVLGMSAGPIMASAASTTLVVSGVGGHGAVPESTKDPVVAAAGIITAVQSIVSRQIPPREPAVITFGSIHGGTAGNIIPETVEIKGTVRAFSKEIFDSLEERMRSVITATAAAYRTTAEFTFVPVVPTLENKPELVEWVMGPLAEVVGKEGIVPVIPSMGSEDFAHFSSVVPGLFCFFGIGNEAKKSTVSWHNPAFIMDEQALPIAAATHAQVAYAWLTR